MGEIELVVVIMDGSEDSRVIALLLHRLNGECSAAIITPKDLGTDNVGKNLATYMSKGVKQRAFLVVLDQEELQLNEVWRRIEDSLKKHGIAYKECEPGDRWKIYSCNHGDKEFLVGVVINGRDLPFQKHSIEDHLLELLNKLADTTSSQQLTSLRVAANSSKDAWSKIAKNNHDVQRMVYSAVVNSEHASTVFQQHVNAVERLRKMLRGQRFDCGKSST
ncbi:MAG: hypothetical protein QXO17_07435 [Nitrososphaerota archaeon]